MGLDYSHRFNALVFIPALKNRAIISFLQVNPEQNNVLFRFHCLLVTIN
jgi:hypothetical protein